MSEELMSMYVLIYGDPEDKWNNFTGAYLGVECNDREHIFEAADDTAALKECRTFLHPLYRVRQSRLRARPRQLVQRTERVIPRDEFVKMVEAL